MVQKEPIKDSVVGVRCNAEMKASLERLASSMDMSVSRLIFRMIKRGMSLEKERSEKIRQILDE